MKNALDTFDQNLEVFHNGELTEAINRINAAFGSLPYRPFSKSIRDTITEGPKTTDSAQCPFHKYTEALSPTPQDPISTHIFLGESQIYEQFLDGFYDHFDFTTELDPTNPNRVAITTDCVYPHGKKTQST